MLITLMVTITMSVLNAWNQSAANLTTENQARFVFNQLATDLEGMLFKQDGNNWLAATVQRDQTVDIGGGATAGDTKIGVSASGSDKPPFYTKWTPINNAGSGTTTTRKPSSSASGSNNTILGNNKSFDIDTSDKLEDWRFGHAGVWLRFFTTGTIESQPCAVSYQLIRIQIGNPAVSAQYRYMFFRSEVSAENTIKAGYNIIYRGSYTDSSNSNAGKDVYDIGNGDSNYRYPGIIRRPAASLVIANDIIDFGIRFFARNATTGYEEEIFPHKAGNVTPSSVPFTFVATSNPDPTSNSDPAAYTGYGNDYQSTWTGIPVAAEIMLRILTPEGSKILEDFERSRITTGNWWEIAEKYSKVYTRRISLKTNAL